MPGPPAGPGNARHSTFSTNAFIAALCVNAGKQRGVAAVGSENADFTSREKLSGPFRTMLSERDLARSVRTGLAKVRGLRHLIQAQAICHLVGQAIINVDEMTDHARAYGGGFDLAQFEGSLGPFQNVRAELA
jgi:hypothetical protein